VVGGVRQAMSEQWTTVGVVRRPRSRPSGFMRRAIVGACAALAGCASAQDYVDAFAQPSPTVDEMSICHGYGCRLVTTVRIEPSAQAEFANLFRPPSRDAAEERVRLGRAIALFEIKVGVAIGSSHDRFAATTFNKNDDPGQLDCIDETVNTTTYLRVLSSLGLLRFHKVGKAAQRGSLSGFAFNDFVTNTAVIVERGTGARFAVDSYFFANGQEPKIMALDAWRRNWRPSLDDSRLKPVLPGKRTAKRL
jgi:hypothetical protein